MKAQKCLCKPVLKNLAQVFMAFRRRGVDIRVGCVLASPQDDELPKGFSIGRQTSFSVYEVSLR
jgi:hypothetical protein